MRTSRLPASPALNCDIPQNYLEPILVQDADGVTTTVLDRGTDIQYQIHSKYLIGADGARSKVAKDNDLPLEAQMDIAGSMHITFKADLASPVEHRSSVLYWVIQPAPEVDEAAAKEIVYQLLGTRELDVEITGTSLWGDNELYATRLQPGRVLSAE